MKEFWLEQETKKFNKKKLIILIIILLLIVLIATIIIIYNQNKEVREWIDKNIFRKEVIQDNATIIELEDQNSNVYAFNKYIGVLNKNNFDIYNNLGKKETNFTVEITTPIFKSTNRFLVIAEDKGKKVYLIEDKKIKWEIQVDGDISQVYVNRNGYVAVVLTDTIHKNVIQMINSERNTNV